MKPCAHGVKPLAGLNAARSGTQGSLASSATLGWFIKRLRRNATAGHRQDQDGPRGVIQVRHQTRYPKNGYEMETQDAKTQRTQTCEWRVAKERSP